MFSSYYMDKTGHVYPNQMNQDDVRVVVISPEDHEQVERLITLFADRWGYDESTTILQAALREFANPTPPKPEEPTGLGAVVADVDGTLWTRTLTPAGDVTRKPRGPWVPDSQGSPRPYDAIDVVSKLSDGIEPLADWERDLLRGQS